MRVITHSQRKPKSRPSYDKPWPTPEKIAKIVCRQADAGTIMEIIRPSNPIMIGLRRLSLEFL